MLWLVRSALSRLAFAAIAMWAWSGIALASDWNVETVTDGSFIFRNGSWAPLKLGEGFARDALLMTDATGSLKLRGDGVHLILGRKTRTQVFSRVSESLTSIYQYSGTIGLHIDEANKEFRVETPFAIVKARMSAFAVQTGADSSLVAVAGGQVAVFDLTRNSEIDVESGKSVLAERGRPLTDGPAASERLSVDTPEGLNALAILPERTST